MRSGGGEVVAEEAVGVAGPRAGSSEYGTLGDHRIFWIRKGDTLIICQHFPLASSSLSSSPSPSPSPSPSLPLALWLCRCYPVSSRPPLVLESRPQVSACFPFDSGKSFWSDLQSPLHFSVPDCVYYKKQSAVFASSPNPLDTLRLPFFPSPLTTTTMTADAVPPQRRISPRRQTKQPVPSSHQNQAGVSDSTHRRKKESRSPPPRQAPIPSTATTTLPRWPLLSSPTSSPALTSPHSPMR